MSVDPEALEYVSVDESLMSSAAAAYRDGLLAQLAARNVVTDEQLPSLSFLGHSVGPDRWTRIETDQGTHWYTGDHETDPDGLRQMAYELGATDGSDRWRRADGTGWYE